MLRFIERRIPLLIVLGLVFAEPLAAVQAEPVKLAVFLPLSNVFKAEGLQHKRGFLFGIKEELAAHDVPWDSWVSLEFFDTRSDPEHTLKRVKEAVADGARAILGPASSSAVTLKLRDYVLDEARIPLIVFSGSASDKLRTRHPLFIRLTFSVQIRISALTQWLTTHPMGASDKPRWACVYSNNAFGVSACNGFKRAYGSVGEEVGQVPIPLKTVSVKSELVQLAKLNPDFALSAVIGASGEIFIKNYYRFKLHERFPLVAVSASPLTPKRLQAYAETLDQYGTGVGILSVNTYDKAANNPINQDFVARFRQTHNDEFPAFQEVQAYDGGRLLVKALVELQGQWDGARVVELMKTLPYKSPRHGQQLAFDSHGDAINVGYILKTQREGDQLVKKLIGQTPPINLDEALK